jgi:hypothetical protein
MDHHHFFISLPLDQMNHLADPGAFYEFPFLPGAEVTLLSHEYGSRGRIDRLPGICYNGHLAITCIHSVSGQLQLAVAKVVYFMQPLEQFG